MAEFLHGDDLNAELGRIFRECEEQLIIISPFIQLHSRYRDALRTKIENPKLKITIVFGKNDEKIYKSFSNEEFEFLKQFPNIEIKYEKRLHAKYYANEKSAILSSMNLYKYSQNNNIEFGIYTEATFLGNITGSITGNTLDVDAFKYFQEVINHSKTLFHKKPIYLDGNLLQKVRKKYSHSEEVIDDLSHRLVKPEKKVVKKIEKNEEKVSTEITGYCIRTGEKIPFNPEKPLTQKAFKQWNKYGDRDYSEKYCHYSGEPSKGETTVAKPILRKNWKKAMN
ncbi:phospholipase D family protein [Salegentibacter flavus]|uniref:PLD-like domain-containing protein n=1 Tax=Salegentibacter flavus TaxID=287099 RepID=A0A1I4YH12_9FLAO|nr:phospholipase D family protein [Salegentibacter flavus]SFN37331.1 PLD-like domain-containing protein [Salegentibacter flavus]